MPVRSLDEDDADLAELAELYENVARNDLDQAARDASIVRCGELQAKMAANKAAKAEAAEGGHIRQVDGKVPPPKKKPHRKVDGAVMGRPREEASKAGVARVKGVSASASDRAHKRSKAIGGPETLMALSGTSLGTGTELDALAKLPEPARVELIAKAKTGAKVSAVAVVKKSSAPIPDELWPQLRAVIIAYHSTTREEQVKIHDWVVAAHTAGVVRAAGRSPRGFRGSDASKGMSKPNRPLASFPVNLPARGKAVQLEPDLKEPAQEAAKQFTAFLAALSPAWDFDFRLIWPKAHLLPFGCELAYDARLDNQNEAFDDLRDMNEGGYGVYVTVTETDGDGVKAANVTRIRACFADLDDGLPDRDWPLPPSMVVRTSPNKFQAYWLLADRMAQEQFAQVEARLVASYGADPNAVDLARVLRVPGFDNTKGERFPVRFAIKPTGEVYTPAELVAAFPPIAEPAQRKPSKPSPVSQPVTVAVLKSALDHLAAIPHPAVKRLDHKYGGGLSTSYADSYDTWWKFGIAIYRALGDDGFELWDEWSKSSRTYPGIAASHAKWATFAAGARHDDACTVGSVFHAAKRHGWSHGQAVSRSLLRGALSKFNNEK